MWTLQSSLGALLSVKSIGIRHFTHEDLDLSVLPKIIQEVSIGGMEIESRFPNLLASILTIRHLPFSLNWIPAGSIPNPIPWDGQLPSSYLYLINKRAAFILNFLRLISFLWASDSLSTIVLCSFTYMKGKVEKSPFHSFLWAWQMC